MVFRKQASEEGRVLKRIEEGLVTYDRTAELLQGAETELMKVRLEENLKRELKKMQRLRLKICEWQRKDPFNGSELQSYRVRIEEKMKHFKIVEKESKVRAYSKEGLKMTTEVDQAKEERYLFREWVTDSISRLNSQVESLEADIESLRGGAGKRKRKTRVSQEAKAFRSKIQRSQYHVGMLERVLRAVDNDMLDVKYVRGLKEDVSHYIEYNGEPDFVENNLMFEYLDVPDISSGSKLSAMKRKQKDTAVDPVGSPCPTSTSKETAEVAGLSQRTIGKREEEPQRKRRIETCCKSMRAETSSSVIRTLGSNPDDSIAPLESIAHRSTMRSEISSQEGPSQTKTSTHSMIPMALPEERSELMVRGNSKESLVPLIRIPNLSEPLTGSPRSHNAWEVPLRGLVRSGEINTSELSSPSTKAVASISPHFYWPSEGIIENTGATDHIDALLPEEMGQVPVPSTQLTYMPSRKIVEELRLVQRDIENRMKVKDFREVNVEKHIESDGNAFTNRATHDSAVGELLQHGFESLQMCNYREDDGIEIVPYRSDPNGQEKTNLDMENTALSYKALLAEYRDYFDDQASIPGETIIRIPAQGRDLLLLAETNDGVYNALMSNSHFPQRVSRQTETSRDYERYTLELLFYAFYHEQGSTSQYMSRNELNRRDWRFHSGLELWMQRTAFPSDKNEYFEVGSYIYWDWRTAFSGDHNDAIKTMDAFLFEYMYLEGTIE